MRQRLLRWRSWLLLSLLGFAISAVVSGTSDVLVMLDPTFRISTDGAAAHLPSAVDYALTFALGALTGLLLSVFTVIPALLITRVAVGVLRALPPVLCAPLSAVVGGAVGLAVCLGIWLAFGGWGPPYVFTFVATGAVVGLGWWRTLRQRMTTVT